MYWSTGSQASTVLRSVGTFVFHGSVKRAKYQDESTKVSMVWVSRRARPPPAPGALWALDVFPGRVAVERIARLVEGHVFRQRHRQFFFRHRHRAAFVAVDDWDWAAPIALARDAPVAQAVVNLALRHRKIVARLPLQPLGDFFLCFVDGHAVEEARIDHVSLADVGSVGDDEGFRILVGRADHRSVAEPVFVDEIEVALVVRRAAENGASAVFH